MSHKDVFNAKTRLEGVTGSILYYRLGTLQERGAELTRLPFTLKILLENALRHADGELLTVEDVLALAHWRPGNAGRSEAEYAFMPGRVLLQDFTGVPAVADLAAMRSAMARMGGDPQKVNPLVPADLVIDHSVQVDQFGSTLAFQHNVEREYERNSERYGLLRWGQQAFSNFRVVPPGTGICHQVNLEYLASVVMAREVHNETIAFPDTLVGTDSHTTMVNGLGVLGWGVGGIEAEAVLLGQPLYLLTPEVIGVYLRGALPEGATATDLVLTVTQLLRRRGVVGKFVEFTGPGLSSLPLADRATISNMSPEFGATATLFPVDEETLRYLRMTGRDEQQITLIEQYTRAQGLFRTDELPAPLFDDLLELDLATIEPCLAGPHRPQDRVPMQQLGRAFRTIYADRFGDEQQRGNGEHNNGQSTNILVQMGDTRVPLSHGSVAIAAITSCTNTSNPSVMIAAGLLAQHAVERGLAVKPTVKTSLAPGSRTVIDYLHNAGLIPYLEALRFHLVGYGCTTCIAAGTPVLLANGTARRIERMPEAGGAMLLAPTTQRTLGTAAQAAMLAQGVRTCISLVLQDGRSLVCTPDHEILRADGHWVRADQLTVGRDRVVVGPQAPLDEPAEDEAGYVLCAGELTFTMESEQQRLRTLAFARLLGRICSDGSSCLPEVGQGLLRVEQIRDREGLLADLALLSGQRPPVTRGDAQIWTITLPVPLRDAIASLPGVWASQQPVHLPSCVQEQGCPLAVVREFLGGLFGAHGLAPAPGYQSPTEVTLQLPAYTRLATPDQVQTLRQTMGDLIHLLARCGVSTGGASIHEEPGVRADSWQQGPLVEVRLQLPDGLSFIERVGYRYCADKTLRACAAAVYWRQANLLRQQRRLTSQDRPVDAPALAPVGRRAAVALRERPATVSPQPSEVDRLPAPLDLLNEIGAGDWFALPPPLGKSACDSDRQESTLPALSLLVVERRPAGQQAVFDLSVNDLHAFVAGTVAVHNCIGNSGLLVEPVARAVQDNDLVVAAVLSGNRNFEGRIHPQVRASFLASPPLVVAYALAGTVDIDLTTEPLGIDSNGEAVYLRDLWPSQQEVSEVVAQAVSPEVFQKNYASVSEGDEHWRALATAGGQLFAWDPASTYIQEPPFFQNMSVEPEPIKDIRGARVLAILDDSITTDHISPAGSFSSTSPAGTYLIEHGVQRRDFNTYGARRGNHEVMVRGTFGNIRLRNQLVAGKEGYYTLHQPGGEETTIFEASTRYRQENVPLIVIAGKEYGAGSSRDWAAKGPLLLGIRAAIAESFERIHRSNLVGMGILPLQFRPGENKEALGLTGHETYDIMGSEQGLKPRQEMTVRVTRQDGTSFEFQAIARLDSPIDVTYYTNGGILLAVLRRLLRD
jgi:aconitase A